MKPYRNISRESGVRAYEIGSDYIRIRFRESNDVYTYNYKSAGKTNVEQMKTLAEYGRGLSTFVTRNVREKFVR